MKILSLAQTVLSILWRLHWDWLINLYGYLPTYLNLLTDKHTSLSIRVDWPTNTVTSLIIYIDWSTNISAWLYRFTDKPAYQPICLGWLTYQHTSLLIYLGWLTNQDTSIIYPVWLIGQRTWLSIWVDCTTNIPAYLSRFTNRPTYQTTQVYWQTSIPTNLSGLTNLPTNKPIYVGWLTGLSIQIRCLTIYLGWLYDHYTSLSIRVD